jgi:hypothetical protein
MTWRHFYEEKIAFTLDAFVIIGDVHLFDVLLGGH